MPEGKLRSGVYRSFIMCDDPRDVVECGAIKKQSKSRSSSTKQRCEEHRSKAKERSEMAVEPRKSSTEDVAPSSLQLLRVSKGIQKLNVAIESWTKGFSFEAVSRPEDIAKDLLRGALDLEESLAMLSSIQEDDSKRKPRICNDGRSDLRFQRSMSDRFGERVEKRMMVQENVASKDCYEELRKVIRESFLRQNLVSQTTTIGTKTRVVRSDFASSSGAASSSTSSSQSSMVSGSTKSSASSDIPRRAPSLIARLMGLDVSTQEPSKSTVNHIDKADVLKLSSERQEKVKKNQRKEIPEIVRCNSTREAVLQSLPEEIPSENPSTIVLIRPMRVVKPEMEEKPGNKRPVVPKKPRMQGEVHPRMINQKKDHQAKESNKMKLPLSMTKKDKEMVRKVEDSEGKVIKLMSPSNGKALTRDRKPLETNKTNKKLVVKKEDIAEGKDRHRHHDRALKPPSNPATQKKSNNPSDVSRNKSRGSSRLSSSSSSGSREKKSGEASRPNAKKKLRQQQDNNLGSENNSSSSQDTHGSLNRLSTEETTTSSEFHNQGQCDNGEVSSCAATIHYSHEPEISQISLKSFLSSSSEFISYAEDLFDFNTDTKQSQESNFQNRDNIVISDQRLALDFAKEVTRRKSLLLAEQPCHTRSSLHIDEVLMEVCDGFESLGSYKDTFSGQNSFVKETIHLVLEKDLKGKKTKMTSGVWDLGWRNEFQIDETYQAVVDLEKLIFSSLIQEIIS